MLRLRSIALLCGLALSLVGSPAALAGDVPTYSRPDDASKALRAKDLPFQLWYDPAKWKVGPQRSNFRLLARAVHKDGNVSGAFVYRNERASVEAIRERAVGELEAAFASHEVSSFSRREVNGLDILFLKASAKTSDGTEVVVRNYYWQGPQGVADYGLVTNRDLFDRYKQDMMDLLNGLRLKEGASFEADSADSGS